MIRISKFTPSFHDDFSEINIPITNIVVNGNFTDATGWAATYGSLTSASNELTYTVTATHASSRIEQLTDIAIVGHKYYVRGDIYPKYANSTYFRIGGANSVVATNIVLNTWNSLSAIITAVDATRFRFYHATNTDYVNTDIIKFRKVLAIDLTKAYGAGLEPTTEQMDAIMDSYLARYEGWFSGTIDLFNSQEAINNIATFTNGRVVTTTENLFDKDSVTIGGYLNAIGVFTANAEYCVSDFIPVIEGAYYIQKTSSYVNFYDVDKARVDIGEYSSGGSGGSGFAIPTGQSIVYMRLNSKVLDLDAEMVVEDNAYPSVYIPYSKYNLKDATYRLLSYAKSKLYGKKWNAYGDSITSHNYGYRSIIAANVGSITVRNYGLSGRSLASRGNPDDTTYPPAVTDYVNMNNDADIITIFLGTNDFGSQVPLGLPSSTTITEFYGALNVLSLGLLEKFPGKKICYITPLQRNVAGDSLLSIPITDYVNAIKIIAAKFSIPCLDLYTTSGLYPASVAIATAYFDAEKLHPNRNGCKVFAPRIQSFMESL